MIIKRKYLPKIFKNLAVGNEIQNIISDSKIYYAGINPAKIKAPEYKDKQILISKIKGGGILEMRIDAIEKEGWELKKILILKRQIRKTNFAYKIYKEIIEMPRKSTIDKFWKDLKKNNIQGKPLPKKILLAKIPEKGIVYNIPKDKGGACYLAQNINDEEGLEAKVHYCRKNKCYQVGIIKIK